ncbi:hypothetical protein Ahy_B05g074686 isoform A [Arachis hypogaea]|uniref:General transcription and DNA repair factor IIH subunit TFB5 n=1 Tax=Arachis hypogaea TaxID=3818 RepID=A0A444YZK3_ARAHY|nr:hypothetical protein Ahy_B05g074686 isoform A [Arachis hypogaea]
MVNAIKGVFISCDIPMAQYIINMNASLPASDKFIIHILDSTHMFVQPQPLPFVELLGYDHDDGDGGGGDMDGGQHNMPYGSGNFLHLYSLGLQTWFQSRKQRLA